MAKAKNRDEVLLSSNTFPVVGIGASAGGLAAVKEFLEAVPEKSGMAYVFVQHLSKDHKSMLPEILQKSAKFPVHLITDNIHLEPDNLYIIPANKIVTATDGILKLAALNNKNHIIDLFFSSLAVVHQSYAIGIVLSGLLDDGTIGLQAIKAYGGITFAQDEKSAAFDDMPKNAVSTGAVDFVLPPGKIAEHLISINTPFHKGNPSGSDTALNHDEEVFRQLLTVLRVRRGVDFTYYKTSTLKRRIIRRMAINLIKKPDSYLTFLRENKNEQDALYNDMLISVTNFFRDPESFELLCTTIFPALIEQKGDGEALRIWIAGCATGEEAYSMAICLHEMLGDKIAAKKIQIFASDISEIAIAKARMGVYRTSDLEGLSPSRITQFFTRHEGNFQINKDIREMCVFAHHNFLKDPPFSRMDLISCRNVLIYLEPVLQRKALTTFHYALNDYGHLLLGKSESINNNPELFSTFDQSQKIYVKKGARGRFMHVASKGNEQNFKDIDKGAKKEGGRPGIFKIADDLLLEDYTPAGVIINQQFDIIKFRGKIDPWLSLPAGKASLNILKLAREGLSFELRTMLHAAKKSSTPIRKEGIVFKGIDVHHYTNIEVVSLPDAEEPHFLVMFENKAFPVGQAATGEPEESYRQSTRRIEQLEAELMQVRADMRDVTEDQEAVYEELQSANQELLSSSEEMQTINEELETSKEELQSTNEEISIVNFELLTRNDELNDARTYTEGIINTIGDPLLILDKDLKVKRATNGFYAKFQVTDQETEGRFVYELGNHQWDIPGLRTVLEGILPEKKIVSDFEVTHVFPTIGKKIMRLNARQLERINGDPLILLAIEDITDKRIIEEGLAAVEKLFVESKSRLKLAVDAAGLGTWDYNPLTKELIWDSRCKEMFGMLPDEPVSYEMFLSMVHADDKDSLNKILNQVLEGQNEGEFDRQFRTGHSAGNKDRWLKFKGKAYFDKDNVAYRFVGTSLDITAEKVHEGAVVELLKQKDDFMSIASHELKTPITSLQASLQLLDKLKDDTGNKMFPILIAQANKSMGKVNILISDLLNVSKINHGQLHTSMNLFPIAKLIDECCTHIRTEDNYTLRTTGDKNLKVYADIDRIEQVLINLVNNAVKYAPLSKEIIIDISRHEGMVKVSVKDKGPGIRKDMLPDLFDRYYRVDSSGSQYSGLGLGLYICAEIIKKHGGGIGVDSEVGEGSTFWFTLPVAKAIPVAGPV